MNDFYNDNEPTAAAWLRELVAQAVIPEGHVDERSFEEITPADVRGRRRCHFFAGIGGWAHALDLGGWDPARPVWTASLPCQPFSDAGKRKGQDDDRHLWPGFFRLVRECRPATLFGEQVDSSDGLEWLARVQADLESEGYAVGRASLPAACVGAPHRRHRLFWVANADGRQPRDGGIQRGGEHGQQPQGRGVGRLPDAAGERRGRGQGSEVGHDDNGPVAERQEGVVRATEPGEAGLRHADGLGDAERQGREGGVIDELRGVGRRREGRESVESGAEQLRFWSRYETVACRDGKSRRVEPGVFPLAHGVSGRVGLLRGYGNAIVPQVAAKFVQAYLEAEQTLRVSVCPI